MTQVMTPSVPMTDGQIDKVTNLVRDFLRKHRLEFSSDAVQTVLGAAELPADMVAPLRRRVEAISEMIVRRVKVKRNRTPQEVINATGRVKYVTRDVVETMPRGEGEEVDVYFFPLKRTTSCADFQKVYEERGLKPDPYAQAAVNEDDPTFADEKPNGCQWQDADGKYCYAAFRRYRDGRYVGVGRNDDDWRDYWWVGGVRK